MRSIQQSGVELHMKVPLEDDGSHEPYTIPPKLKSLGFSYQLPLVTPLSYDLIEEVQWLMQPSQCGSSLPSVACQ
jgi:hypothetical protein